MATSDEFKQHIKAGNLSEALKIALAEVIELKITTWVVPTVENATESASDFPEATPGYRMMTRINIVDGEIDNEVGSQFLNSGPYSELREFHLNQVQKGREIIYRNLQVLKDLFSTLAVSTSRRYDTTQSAVSQLHPQISPILDERPILVEDIPPIAPPAGDVAREPLQPIVYDNDTLDPPLDPTTMAMEPDMSSVVDIAPPVDAVSDAMSVDAMSGASSTVDVSTPDAFMPNVSTPDIPAPDSSATNTLEPLLFTEEALPDSILEEDALAPIVYDSDALDDSFDATSAITDPDLDFSATDADDLLAIDTPIPTPESFTLENTDLSQGSASPDWMPDLSPDLTPPDSTPSDPVPPDMAVADGSSLVNDIDLSLDPDAYIPGVRNTDDYDFGAFDSENVAGSGIDVSELEMPPFDDSAIDISMDDFPANQSAGLESPSFEIPSEMPSFELEAEATPSAMEASDLTDFSDFPDPSVLQPPDLGMGELDQSGLGSLLELSPEMSAASIQQPATTASDPLSLNAEDLSELLGNDPPGAIGTPDDVFQSSPDFLFDNLGDEPTTMPPDPGMSLSSDPLSDLLAEPDNQSPINTPASVDFGSEPSSAANTPAPPSPDMLPSPWDTPALGISTPPVESLPATELNLDELNELFDTDDIAQPEPYTSPAGSADPLISNPAEMMGDPNMPGAGMSVEDTVASLFGEASLLEQQTTAPGDHELIGLDDDVLSSLFGDVTTDIFSPPTGSNPDPTSDDQPFADFPG